VSRPADIDRPALRRALLEAAPWLDATDVGPRAVDAGPCDRCGTAPRVVPTCGPAGADAVCRDCALDLGDDGWCDGHRRQGVAARRWATALPDTWADAVTLWWFATGELRAVAPELLRRGPGDTLGSRPTSPEG
jgi:hypothetical protein